MLSLLVWVLATLPPQAAEPPHDPAALVQQFYERYPHELEGGLPRGRELDWLAGFLSVELSARFRAALDYQQRWIRENPDRPPFILKPPFADGVHFTGAPDAIDSFRVLPARARGSGIWHVPVHFWFDPELPGSEAVVVVKEQRGRYLIDEIIFLDEEPWCLSEALDWED